MNGMLCGDYQGFRVWESRLYMAFLFIEWNSLLFGDTKQVLRKKRLTFLDLKRLLFLKIMSLKGISCVGF